MEEGANGKREALARRRIWRNVRTACAALLVGSVLGVGVAPLVWPLAPPADESPPAIVAVDPAEGTFLRTGPAAFRIAFSERLARSPSVTFAGTETLAVTESSFDESMWLGEALVPAGSDGAYVLQVADVADLVGNVLAARALAYGVDTVPPTSRAMVATNATSTPFDLTWDASDGDGSGVARVELWIRADEGQVGPWMILTVSPETRGAYRLDPGPHSARFDAYTVAVDRAGNAEAAPNAPQATVDYNLPLPRATILPLGRHWVRDTVPLTIAASPGTTRVEVLSFFSSDNRTWRGPTLAGIAADPFPFTFRSGAGGFYRLAARAYDARGRAEAMPTLEELEVFFAVDTDPPRAVLASPAEYWQQGPLTLTANVSDDASGVASVSLAYAHRANATAWSAWRTFGVRAAPPFAWTFRFPEGDGHYAFALRAEDIAGNVRDASGAEVTIGYDAVPPSASLLPIPGYWRRGLLNVSAMAGGGVTDAELRYYVAADNATWQGPFPFGNATAPFAWTFSFPFGPGHYRLYARARDADGQTEADQRPEAAEVHVGHDNAAPSSELTSVAGYWFNASLTVNATATDDRSGVAALDLFYAYRPNASAAWSAWMFADTDWEAPYAVSFPFPRGDGRYALAARARDNAGNEEPLPPIAGADATIGFNREPPVAPHLFLPSFIDPLTWTANLTWIGGPSPDIAQFQIHRGTNASFAPDLGPCPASATCVGEVGAGARTAWAPLGAEGVTTHFRVVAIDEGGLANGSASVAAIYHGRGYDSPNGFARPAPLPVAIAWAERLDFDGTCEDCADYFATNLWRGATLALRLAVPVTGDFRLVVFDAALENVWIADAAGFGGSETLSVRAPLARTYYVVVDWGNHADGMGRNEGWYTLSAEVLPA